MVVNNKDIKEKKEVLFMKKGFRNFLALILCLIVVVSASPLAIAVSQNEANAISSNATFGYNFRGVYRVKISKSINVDIPSAATSAQNYNFYIVNTEVASVKKVSGSNKVSITGEWYGATVLTFYTYKTRTVKDGNKTRTEYEKLNEYNYAVVVYDDEDEQSTGKVTSVTVNDVTATCGKEGKFKWNYKASGDVYAHTIFYTDDANNIMSYYEDDGTFCTFADGTADFICYLIDTNGNIVSDTFKLTSTSKISFWQRIVNFFQSIRDFFLGIFRS